MHLYPPKAIRHRLHKLRPRTLQPATGRLSMSVRHRVVRLAGVITIVTGQTNGIGCYVQTNPAMDELLYPRTGVAASRATSLGSLYRHAPKGLIPGIMILSGIMYDQRAALVYTACSFSVEWQSSYFGRSSATGAGCPRIGVPVGQCPATRRIGNSQQ